MQGHYISITVTAYRSVWVYRNVAFGDVFDSRLDADMRRNANFKVEVAPHPPPPPFITIDTIYDHGPSQNRVVVSLERPALVRRLSIYGLL